MADGVELAKFSTKNPSKLLSSASISGLQAGEKILAIDFRPATGQLYGLGSSSRLYVLDPENGTARMIGAAPFEPLLSGELAGFDFNPTVDRIRITSNSGQNLRVNPLDGVVVVDGPLNPGTPMVTASAYTNNFAAATSTMLFGIDVQADKLYTQNPPNSGTLVEIGSLGIDAQAANGFDIGGTTGIAYAILTAGSSTKLYAINTTTGAAKAMGNFSTVVKGITIGLGF